MLGEIGFGIIDNGVLIGGAILGFSLEDIINLSLDKALCQTKYVISTRIKGLSSTLLGAGVSNAISDFLGGWCVSWQMAFGTFFGCMLVVIMGLPLIFKLTKRKGTGKEDEKNLGS